MNQFDFFESAKQSSRVSRKLTLEQLADYMKLPALKNEIDAIRNGDKERKTNLPCVCYMGRSTNGTRKVGAMKPTGLIMLDIDHCENPKESFESIKTSYDELKAKDPQYPNLVLVHITPSGKGLRLILVNHQTPMSVEENIKAFDQELNLGFYGELDMACKDLTRVSFLVSSDDILFSDFPKEDIQCTVTDVPDAEPTPSNKPTNKKPEKIYSDFMYGAMKVKDIADAYCAYYFPEGNHMPPSGSVHTFYNQMVKDFRCICDNKPEILISVLPQFGHSDEECYSQCRSICSRNNLSKLPKPFYFFLKDKGWYVSPFEKKDISAEEEPEDPYKQLDSLIDAMPKLPPVFREFIKSAPRYFKIPYLMSLLPIMGTMTSYLEGKYSGKVQTTSFITVIYAPPASGKSYLVELSEKLLTYLQERDIVASARDEIFDRIRRTKGANDKGPTDPRTPLRIMPAINSIPKILTKMRNNQGYHMFTAVEEMDTWIKGSKGRDGDKNDMYRVAWDNGKYGQTFMSSNTFSGIVRLYWNILITGTIDQVLAYFKNIENGMITRCSFSDLGDQMFTLAPEFKPFNKRDQAVIDKFKEKCDRNSYLKPMVYDKNSLYDIEDTEFDDKIDWKQEFRPRQEVDVDWIIPHLTNWCIDQNTLSSKSNDHARGVFHRRVAVRGYRLAMLCTALYETIRDREKAIILDFVLWYMECDLYGILKLFGKRYNEHFTKSTEQIQEYRFADIFAKMGDVFTAQDLFSELQSMGFKSSHYAVLNVWKKNKLIEKIEKNKYKKLKK